MKYSIFSKFTFSSSHWDLCQWTVAGGGGGGEGESVVSTLPPSVPPDHAPPLPTCPLPPPSSPGPAALILSRMFPGPVSASSNPLLNITYGQFLPSTLLHNLGTTDSLLLYLKYLHLGYNHGLWSHGMSPFATCVTLASIPSPVKLRK